jgi:hypothetical protein
MVDNRASIYTEYFSTFWRVASERCRRYYGTDKPNGHAAGLESLVYFAGLVIETMPGSWRSATIIDAGAGASSAILRTYFDDVISCDPDADYLAQVRVACAELRLPDGRWVEGLPADEADATFYDYGTRHRIPTFRQFLDLSQRMIWVDDAQDREVLDACTAVCRERGLELRPARGAHDEHGRFGAYALTRAGEPARRERASEVDELRNEYVELHREWEREFEINRGQRELLKLYETSLSWRVTRPLRAFSHLIQR